MKRLKQPLKIGLRLIIDSGGNPVTLVMNLTKPRLHALLDVLLPDELEPIEPQ